MLTYVTRSPCGMPRRPRYLIRHVRGGARRFSVRASRPSLERGRSIELPAPCQLHPRSDMRRPR